MTAPPTQIGQYRIVRKLGEGGMGVVYEGVNDQIQRRVAIKQLSPDYARDAEATQRLFNEARAVNVIEHPSLVQISDFGQTADGAPYLVMEFLKGESLGARLQRLHKEGNRLPLAQVLELTVQVAEALAAAHAKGIVHRDLKPDNLMLIEDPVAPGGERVKVLDFGIAKLSLSGVKKTATGTLLGTPLYMSPEQCSGSSESTDRSDVYSLGVMLFEMLAGQPPFIAPGAGELIGRHLFQEPPPLRRLAPEAPAELAALVHRLLIKDKLQRPAMSQVVAELHALQTKLPGGLLPNRRTPRPENLPAAATALNGNRQRIELASTLGRLLGEVSPRPSARPVALAGLAVFLLVALVGAGVYRHYASGRRAAGTATLAPAPGASLAAPPLAAPPPAGASLPAESPAPPQPSPRPASPAHAAAKPSKPPRPASPHLLKGKKTQPKSIAHED